VLNLALHGVHTRSNGARGVRSIAKNNMSIMVRAYYCARWGHIELWHGAMHREKCMWNISARYK
jgi:hypothetical protein